MIDLTVGCARVVCTDRHHGVSTPPYATANLADHVGDEPGSVAENRRRLAGALGPGLPDPRHWVWLRQVHGAGVLVVDQDRAPAEPVADAAVTDRPGLPLVVLVADCAPIALVGQRAVGVVHAGWAGLELGVVERAVESLRAVDREAGSVPERQAGSVPERQAGSVPERQAGSVRAVVGPCIHPARYEFGPQLLARMVARFGDVVASTTEWGTPALDVPAAVRAALRAAGVVDVTEVGVCTAASADHFSYRRDGTTGRQALVVTSTA